MIVRILSKLLTLIFGGWWLRWDAKKDERRERELQDAKDSLNTIKEVQNASSGIGSAADVDRMLADRKKR